MFSYTEKSVGEKKERNFQNVINHLTSFNLGYFDKLEIEKASEFTKKEILKSSVKNLLTKMASRENIIITKRESPDDLKLKGKPTKNFTAPLEKDELKNIHFLSMYIEPALEKHEPRQQKYKNQFESIAEAFSRIRCDGAPSASNPPPSSSSPSSQSLMNMSHVLIKMILQQT